MTKRKIQLELSWQDMSEIITALRGHIARVKAQGDKFPHTSRAYKVSQEIINDDKILIKYLEIIRG